MKWFISLSILGLILCIIVIFAAIDNNEMENSCLVVPLGYEFIHGDTRRLIVGEPYMFLKNLDTERIERHLAVYEACEEGS